ncbi:hypothetical protein GCM10009718_31000 [Isoptericola halotolerans]|uniref:DUF559 domain-containing protein n=1 Tax=Isoptericola halotolerans TaxID=300560 RepID=A0ABX2A6Y7_9MICO|nr:hypothetical protein [Isoptericola halotolerans]NOV97562.1 hypothetical protein [Isoptericola halotolerans]
MASMRTFAQLPDALTWTAEAQEGLLSAHQCDLHGVGSSRRSRLVQAGRWRAVTRGVVDTIPTDPFRRTAEDVPVRPALPLVVRDSAAARARSRAARAAAHRPRSDTDRLFDHLRRRAAWIGLLAHGPGAIAVGTSALALHGVEGLAWPAIPEVALDRAGRRPHRPGVRLRQFDDGMTVVGFGDPRTAEARVATMGWALAQAVPEQPPARGLALLDSALQLGLVDARGLEVAHDQARGRRGVASRHVLWEVADARAQSPLESFGRWQCIEAGVPPDVLQLPVSGRDGSLLGLGDMAWRQTSGRTLVVEMDGRDWHESSTDGGRRDRDRDNAFAAVPGVDVLRFDVRHVRDGVVGRRVRTFLRR